MSTWIFFTAWMQIPSCWQYSISLLPMEILSDQVINFWGSDKELQDALRHSMGLAFQIRSAKLNIHFRYTPPPPMHHILENEELCLRKFSGCHLDLSPSRYLIQITAVSGGNGSTCRFWSISSHKVTPGITYLDYRQKWISDTNNLTLGSTVI